MMVGSQEGSHTDYGYAFRQSVLDPRIFVFLVIGVLLFLAITFWPTLVPYLPGRGSGRCSPARWRSSRRKA